MEKLFWPECYEKRWMDKNYVSDLVSVIIPTFNRSGIITEALESVWEQNYRPIEMIIVDDGSTDETSSIINKWVEQHSDDELFNTSYVYQKNKGAPSARNKGLIHSKGEYVQFLDSDDLLRPQKIKKSIMEFRSNSNIDLVYTIWLVEKNGIREFRNGPDLEERPFAYEAVRKYLWTGSPLYKRSVIYKTGPWNENLTRAQDREYCVRVMNQVKNAIKLDYPGAIYRQFLDDNSITASRGSANKTHPISGWKVNQIMTKIIKLEDHPDKRIALKKLSKRNLKVARRAIPCGIPKLTRSIIFRDNYLWSLGPKYWFKIIKLFLLSIVPSMISAPISRYYTKIKLKVN